VIGKHITFKTAIGKEVTKIYRSCKKRTKIRMMFPTNSKESSGKIADPSKNDRT
jgi:hypothetical protein